MEHFQSKIKLISLAYLTKYNISYAYTVEPLNNGQVGALTLVHYSEVVLYWGILWSNLSKFYTGRIIEMIDSLKRNDYFS